MNQPLNGQMGSGAADKIVVDPEFKALIWPLTADERRGLEESVAREGVRDALRAWEHEGSLLLLDGHNRHEIASRLGIQYRVERVDGLETRTAAKLWIAKWQLNRRNLSDCAKVELALIVADLVHEMAKENRRHGGRPTGDTEKVSPVGERISPVHTNKEIAKIAGVGRGTVERIQRAKERGTPELLDAMRSDKVSAIAGDLVSRLPPDEQRALVKKGPDAVRAKSGEMQRAREKAAADANAERASSKQHASPLSRRFDKATAERATIRAVVDALRAARRDWSLLVADAQRDKKYMGRCADRSGYVTEYITQAIEEIERRVMPETECPTCKGEGGQCQTCDGYGWITSEIKDGLRGKSAA